MKVAMVAGGHREKPASSVAETTRGASSGIHDRPTCTPTVAAPLLSCACQCYTPGPPEQSQKEDGRLLNLPSDVTERLTPSSSCPSPGASSVDAAPARYSLNL